MASGLGQDEASELLATPARRERLSLRRRTRASRAAIAETTSDVASSE